MNCLRISRPSLRFFLTTLSIDSAGAARATSASVCAGEMGAVGGGRASPLALSFSNALANTLAQSLAHSLATTSKHCCEL